MNEIDRLSDRDLDSLRKVLDAQLDEEVPDRLLAAATGRAARPAPGRWLSARALQRVAASLAFIMLGGVSGWIARGDGLDRPQIAQSTPGDVVSPDASLARRAAIAHVVYSPDARRPVEIGVDQEDQLVSWLSRRLGADLRPPKLNALGYELIGGRLLPGASGPVAQFMYHDSAGQRLTLYVSNEHATNQDTGFRFAQEGPVNVFYWIDGRFGYALSAGLEKARLAEIAVSVHDQLAHPAPIAHGAPHAQAFVASTEVPFAASMHEAMNVMDHAMQAAPMNGDPDHDFTAMMIPHHQGAVDMAKALLLYTRDPELRNLALGIITEQQNEIRLMGAWLERNHDKGTPR